MQRKHITIWMLFLVTGCGPLLTERRMVKVDMEAQAIQQDFTVLSATFTREQNEKYARVKAVQDDATFQEFLASLDETQRATMQPPLARAHEVEHERQSLIQIVQQDRARQRANRRILDGLTAYNPVGIVP
jgi:hypothetical protein